MVFINGWVKRPSIGLSADLAGADKIASAGCYQFLVVAQYRDLFDFFVFDGIQTRHDLLAMDDGTVIVFTSKRFAEKSGNMSVLVHLLMSCLSLLIHGLSVTSVC